MVKYLFISNPSTIGRDTPFITLMVGQSKSERERLLWLAEYAAENGSVLLPWSHEVDKHLWALAANLFKGARCPSLHLVRAEMSAKELVCHLKNKTLESHFRSWCPTASYFHLLSILEGVSFPVRNIKNHRKRALKPPRLNLSPSHQDELIIVALSALVILLVFLLAGFIEAHYGY